MNINDEEFEKLRKQVNAVRRAVLDNEIMLARRFVEDLSDTLNAIEDRHMADTIGEYDDGEDQSCATVPCKWCGTPTPMTGTTEECNAHWELRSRIEHEPKMAVKMLRELFPNVSVTEWWDFKDLRYMKQYAKPKEREEAMTEFFAERISMVGTRHVCQCCGRALTIIGEYNEPPGYDYVFDGEPGVRWISNHAASVKFTKEVREPRTAAGSLD